MTETYKLQETYVPVEVVWRDVICYAGWASQEESNRMINGDLELIHVTAGYLVQLDSDVVALVSQFHDRKKGDGNVGDTRVFPWTNVIEIRFLERGENVATRKTYKKAIKWLTKKP